MPEDPAEERGPGAGPLQLRLVSGDPKKEEAARKQQVYQPTLPDGVMEADVDQGSFDSSSDGERDERRGSGGDGDGGVGSGFDSDTETDSEDDAAAAPFRTDDRKGFDGRRGRRRASGVLGPDAAAGRRRHPMDG